jgi:sugar transferase (PEP-CTERM/EpsH1 system associated)
MGGTKQAGSRDAGRPVRVMHVVDRLQPGGMELGVVKLVNGLDPGAVVSSICSTRPTAIRHVVRASVPVHELQRRQGNDPTFVWDLFRLFRRERPDVVHTHAWGTLLEGLSAARVAGVPLVLHGEHGTLQLKPMQVRAQRFAWGRVDGLLSVSSRLAERMAAATGFPLERIQVIRNGVDLARFHDVDREAARAALGIAPGAVAVGTAGRLVPVKDHALLLGAAASLAARGTAVTTFIAGDGPLRAELEARAAALGIADRVRFLGHRPDLERVYAALDVFVLCSVSEGLSNTILEAMASGRAVVATRVGGADELVIDRKTGILVPPSAEGALADAIQFLALDAGRRQAFERAARERAESVFGLSRMLADYRAVYRQAWSGLCGKGRDIVA